MLKFSDDVLRLNPELAAAANTARPARVRHQIKSNDLTVKHDSHLEVDFEHELLARGWPCLLHPFTLHLPGGVDYTPDFIAWPPGEKPIIYEVKGSLQQKNARDSRTRFRLAAGIHRWAVFVWVTRRNGAWIERVNDK